MVKPVRKFRNTTDKYFGLLFGSVSQSQLAIVVPALYTLGRLLGPKEFALLEEVYPEEKTMKSAELLAGLYGALALNMQRPAFNILLKYWKSKSKK